MDTQVKIAVISLIGTLGAAVIAGVSGLASGVLSVNSPGGDASPAAVSSPASPAVSPVATVTVTRWLSPAATTSAAPAGQESSQPAAAKPRYLSDLTAVGDAWIEGTQWLGGKKYDHSIAAPKMCEENETEVLYELPALYHHFEATVGYNDNDQHSSVSFTVYDDADGDGQADSDEQRASKGAQAGSPGRIEATFPEGTRRIILTMELSGDCIFRNVVWGTPRVS